MAVNNRHMHSSLKLKDLRKLDTKLGKRQGQSKDTNLRCTIGCLCIYVKYKCLN